MWSDTTEWNGSRGAETRICGEVWWQGCVWLELYVLSRCGLSRRRTRGTFMPWKYCVKLICWRKSRWIAALTSSATSVPWVTSGGNRDVCVRAVMGILGLLAKAVMWLFLPYFVWRKWECCQAVISSSALRWAWEVLCLCVVIKPGTGFCVWAHLYQTQAALCFLGAALPKECSALRLLEGAESRAWRTRWLLRKELVLKAPSCERSS